MIARPPGIGEAAVDSREQIGFRAGRRALLMAGANLAKPLVNVLEFRGGNSSRACSKSSEDHLACSAMRDTSPKVILSELASGGQGLQTVISDAPRLPQASHCRTGTRNSD